MTQDKIYDVVIIGGGPGGSSAAIYAASGELERGERGCIRVDRATMETAIPGVYAVGDVTCARLKQAVISAAEGAVAAISADRFIRNDKKTSPGRYW